MLEPTASKLKPRSKKSAVRESDLIISEYKKLTPKKFIEQKVAFLATITDAEAGALVEKWGDLIDIMNPLEADAKACKEIIQAVGIRLKKEEHTGGSFSVTLGSTSGTNITKTNAEIIEILRKQKKGHLVETFFKFQVGEARKIMGDAFIDSISETVTTPYTKVNSPVRK